MLNLKMGDTTCRPRVFVAAFLLFLAAQMLTPAT